MRVFKAAAATAWLLTLTACAPHASEIAPMPISDVRYDGWACEKLRKEQTFVETSLVRVSSDQDSAADRDALMVFLIGIPTSGGGVKTQVADLKGQSGALHSALMGHSCI